MLHCKQLYCLYATHKSRATCPNCLQSLPQRRPSVLADNPRIGGCCPHAPNNCGACMLQTTVHATNCAVCVLQTLVLPACHKLYCLYATNTCIACMPQTVLLVRYKQLYCLQATNCTVCMLQTTVLPASHKLHCLYATNNCIACMPQTVLRVCYKQLYCLLAKNDCFACMLQTIPLLVRNKQLHCLYATNNYIASILSQPFLSNRAVGNHTGRNMAPRWWIRQLFCIYMGPLCPKSARSWAEQSLCVKSIQSLLLASSQLTPFYYSRKLTKPMTSYCTTKPPHVLRFC